ncbi:MAG TPA: DUF2752 domain-containing protein [bacterium]|nr:DUF2752 domain-containing protein [bacterium]HQL61648.1 DUF2752 domain-containing protein [bacterium]
MILSIRRLGKQEVDHEMIWGAVILFVFAAARWFPFQTIHPPSCPWKMLTGYPCCTCGMTRSLLAFAQGNPVTALLWNPLIGMLAIAASIYFLYALVVLSLRLPRVRISLTGIRERNGIRLLILFAIVGNWMYLIIQGR